MKVGIIGDKKYEDRRKIQEMLFALKEKFGDELVILSGGEKTGAERYVRKFAIEFAIKYEEYNPSCTPKNLYSVYNRGFYGKPYHVSQLHHRYGKLAANCDVLAVFITGKTPAGTLNTAIKQAKRLDKNITLIK